MLKRMANVGWNWLVMKMGTQRRRGLAHVRKAITKAAPSARIVEGDIFGAVGKGTDPGGATDDTGRETEIISQALLQVW